VITVAKRMIEALFIPFSNSFIRAATPDKKQFLRVSEIHTGGD
jgi:hypothetical protein